MAAMTVVRVATYNVYLGADLTLIFGAASPEHLIERAGLVHRQLLGTDFPARAESIARLVARERIDVLGLQEVARWSRAPITADGVPREAQVWCDFLVELLAALDRSGTPYDAYAANASFRGGAAISATEQMSLLGFNVTLVRRGSGVVVTGSATGEFRARVEIPTGMPELVLTVPRSWGSVDLAAGDQRFRFVNTHTEAYDAPVRDAQRDELLQVVGPDGPPVVVVGDFNAGPDEVGMPANFQDAWAVVGDGGPGHTCGQAADLANLDSRLGERIDYVWVRGAGIDACRVVGDTESDRTTAARLWPSDHACVLADIRLG